MTNAWLQALQAAEANSVLLKLQTWGTDVLARDGGFDSVRNVHDADWIRLGLMKIFVEYHHELCRLSVQTQGQGITLKVDSKAVHQAWRYLELGTVPGSRAGDDRRDLDGEACARRLMNHVADTVRAGNWEADVRDIYRRKEKRGWKRFFRG